MTKLKYCNCDHSKLRCGDCNKTVRTYEQGKKDGIKRALEILNYSKSEFKLLEKELIGVKNE